MNRNSATISISDRDEEDRAPAVAIRERGERHGAEQAAEALGESTQLISSRSSFR